jgi:hypothetical protein
MSGQIARTADAAERLAAVTHRMYDAGDHLELATAFYEALALSPVELRRAMRALARREGGAQRERRHSLTLMRLRALLQQEPGEARVLARAFDDAFLDLPSGWREAARELELAVIMNGLHGREFRALTHVLPWLRDGSASAWLLDHLPDADVGESLADATGQPGLAVGG